MYSRLFLLNRLLVIGMSFPISRLKFIGTAGIQNKVNACVEKKNQLDATEWFIALIICSTCFGHFYAHHQEQAAGYASRKRDVARVVQHPNSWTHSLLSCIWPPTTSNQALHTTGGNNTYSLELLMMGIEVSETCWTYYKCNKPSSWVFFSMHMQRCTDRQTSKWT